MSERKCPVSPSSLNTSKLVIYFLIYILFSILPFSWVISWQLKKWNYIKIIHFNFRGVSVNFCFFFFFNEKFNSFINLFIPFFCGVKINNNHKKLEQVRISNYKVSLCVDCWIYIFHFFVFLSQFDFATFLDQ